MALGRLTAVQEDAALNVVEALAQDIAVECMKDLGFVYLPQRPPERVNDPIATNFMSKAYAETYGFGIAASVLFEDRIEVESYLDPNTDYIIGLSPEAQERYNLALQGTGDGTTGCLPEARAEAQTILGLTTVLTEFEAAERAADSDPAVIEARAKWEDCARKAGHPAVDRKDLIDRLRANVPALPPPGELLSATQRQEWERFFEREIIAATATFNCSQEFDGVYQRVVSELANWPEV
jgi:hypothetical protein